MPRCEISVQKVIACRKGGRVIVSCDSKTNFRCELRSFVWGRHKVKESVGFRRKGNQTSDNLEEMDPGDW